MGDDAVGRGLDTPFSIAYRNDYNQKLIVQAWAVSEAAEAKKAASLSPAAHGSSYEADVLEDMKPGGRTSYAMVEDHLEALVLLPRPLLFFFSPPPDAESLPFAEAICHGNLVVAAGLHLRLELCSDRFLLRDFALPGLLARMFGNSSETGLVAQPGSR